MYKCNSSENKEVYSLINFHFFVCMLVLNANATTKYLWLQHGAHVFILIKRKHWKPYRIARLLQSPLNAFTLQIGTKCGLCNYFFSTLTTYLNLSAKKLFIHTKIKYHKLFQLHIIPSHYWHLTGQNQVQLCFVMIKLRISFNV